MEHPSISRFSLIKVAKKTVKWASQGHGKNACDGIGGSVKRLATRASLQRPVEGQILTTADLFDWASENIKNITFFYVSQEKISSAISKQVRRFLAFKKLPGIRSYHSFIPIPSKKVVQGRRVSKSKTFELFSVLKQTIKIEKRSDLLPGKYIAAMHDDKWWLGMVLEVDDENEDYKVRFLHPAGQSPTFYWPQFKDECYIIRRQVLLPIAPLNASSSRRQYTLPKETESEIKKIFEVKCSKKWIFSHDTWNSSEKKLSHVLKLIDFYCPNSVHHLNEINCDPTLSCSQTYPLPPHYFW